MLLAAVQLFLENGYEKTTTAAIARAAGMAPSSFFAAFENKEALLLTLVQQMFNRQFENAEQLLGEQKDPLMLYGIETALQMYITELSEPLRELYVMAYSLPTTCEYIYNNTAERLSVIFADYLPEAEKKVLSLELHVTKETSSAFIVLAEDDQTVSPLNSLAYYTALLKHGVSAELHIYPQGGHSFGFCDSFIYKNLWTNELSQWLNAL